MRPAALLAAMLLAAPTARAQVASAMPAETALHIGESAEVTRAPDEIVANLRAEARAGSAAAAQEAVNRAVTSAVERARAVSSVRVSTGAYWTGRVDEGRSWQAAQSVTLRASESAPLLELVGTLQGAGMVISSLEWRLSRDATRAAREEASSLALDALRRRADAVADQLGMAVAGIREVRIGAPVGTPRPTPMAMAARGPATTTPVAVAEDIVVSATVEAVVVLRPR